MKRLLAAGVFCVSTLAFAKGEPNCEGEFSKETAQAEELFSRGNDPVARADAAGAIRRGLLSATPEQIETFVKSPLMAQLIYFDVDLYRQLNDQTYAAEGQAIHLGMMAMYELKTLHDALYSLALLEDFFKERKSESKSAYLFFREDLLLRSGTNREAVEMDLNSAPSFIGTNIARDWTLFRRYLSNRLPQFIEATNPKKLEGAYLRYRTQRRVKLRTLQEDGGTKKDIAEVREELANLSRAYLEVMSSIEKERREAINAVQSTLSRFKVGEADSGENMAIELWRLEKRAYHVTGMMDYFLTAPLADREELESVCEFEDLEDRRRMLDRYEHREEKTIFTAHKAALMAALSGDDLGKLRNLLTLRILHTEKQKQDFIDFVSMSYPKHHDFVLNFFE